MTIARDILWMWVFFFFSGKWLVTVKINKGFHTVQLMVYCMKPLWLFMWLHSNSSSVFVAHWLAEFWCKTMRSFSHISWQASWRERSRRFGQSAHPFDQHNVVSSSQMYCICGKSANHVTVIENMGCFLFYVNMHKPCMKAWTEARVSPFKPIYRYDNALTSKLNAGI